MNNPKWLMFLGLLVLAVYPLPATGQTVEPESQTTPTPEPASTGSAVDLRISPRFGAGHDSSGAGYDGVTHVEGFIPLFQTPGENLTFLNTRLLLDNDGQLGGNLLLGHRFYDAGSDRIFGGYVGFDARKTDESDFYQLGLGLESLGEVWDFRINGYLPIGDTRQLIDEQVVNGETRISTQFQDHLLMLERQRERLTTQSWEAALGGIDAEVGARLVRWNEGDLRGYGGLYFYDGAGTDGTFGWRVRLEANPNDNLRMGVALQDDDLFGTNLVFSIGANFPGIRPRGPITENETVVARLGEPVVRSNSIVVDGQQETEVEVERTTRPLMNPEEEAPYWFQHVTLGEGNGGDGTFERPFSTVQAALNATRSDGNDIVYVDQGNDSEIPAFTIPDRVTVLSQGPVQILAGMPFPGFPQQQVRLPFSPTPNFNNGILVRLPFSNDGNFPQIRDDSATNTVTLGNRTTLSGFRIADASGNGIFGNGLQNVELRDNIITNAAERGIFLDNVTDSVVMLDNTVTGSRGGSGSGQGIFIRNTINNDAVEVTLNDHQLNNNRVGLEVSASGSTDQSQGSSQTVTIDTLTAQNNREQGIRLNVENFGNQEVSLSDGTIDQNGAEGIRLVAISSGSQEFAVDNSSISQNTGDGIQVTGGNLGGTATAAQEVFIRNNTIENNGGHGIDIEGNEVVAQEFAIDGNTIRNNGGSGIQGIANNVAFQEYVTDSDNGSTGLSNNIISGNGDQGIILNANDSATLVADIQNNQLENNRTAGEADLEVASNSNSADVCVVVFDNNSLAGILLDNNSSQPVPGLFEVGDISTVAARNVGTVEFRPNQSVFTNKPGVTSCFN